MAKPAPKTFQRRIVDVHSRRGQRGHGVVHIFDLACGHRTERPHSRTGKGRLRANCPTCESAALAQQKAAA